MSVTEPPATSLFPGLGLRFRLTRSWGRVLVIGWTALSLSLVCVAASSQIIGRPVWWIDDQRFSTTTLALLLIAVFAVPFGVVVWSLFSGPFAPFVSIVASAEIAVLSVTDRHSSPGSAVVLAALALAALLLSVASFAGLHRVVGFEKGLENGPVTIPVTKTVGETAHEGVLVTDLGSGSGPV